MSAAPALAGVDEAELRKFRRVAERMRYRARHPGGGRAVSARSVRGGLEFAEFRDLQPGDDVRHVDWRNSAGRRHPRVRTYADELSANCWIALDRSASMGLEPLRWSLAVQLAAAFGYLTLHAGHRLGVVQFSGRPDAVYPLGRGRAHFAGLFRWLGAASPRSSGNASRLGGVRDLVGDTPQLTVISDFLTPQGMIGELGGPRSAVNIAAIQIRSGRDVVVPADAEFVWDVETGERRRVAQGFRRDVADRHARWQVAFDALCRRLGVDLTCVSDNASWQDVVITHLEAKGTTGATR